ncbi:hypothetical protein CERZMDRAFT_119213 [Cercospora zeae-maydis SCOH1-5]|uniref:Zn(2)-C6 fungal-type domain-containing protein n=1 Tax=Cercospora zeae-maydis SCOH1-5 TaxID=717836 RepID=A0A6A6EZD7_9PEZI|nr:hypothetical protein CERZMDRAFT_119213 [Cercospora zeae-maydis SCOH1-5]
MQRPERRKLKSKTGCLTCVARRKKCDETPIRCSHCARLNLACMWREGINGNRPRAITSTTLKGGKGPILHATITNGYPPFRSELEKQLSMEAPRVLSALVSCVASPEFRHASMLGTFSTSSCLVRHAIVAFSAHTSGPRSEDSYRLSLKSYQNCITELKSTLSHNVQSSVEQDNHALVAMMFLGLLEGLRIGDSRNAVAHFDMCQRLLVNRLSQTGVPNDSALVMVYRLAAECIMYNLATLLPFDTRLDRVVNNWGTSLQCLFPRDDHELSPFLGGFHDVYQLMLRINVFVRKFQPGNPTRRLPLLGGQDSEEELTALKSELDILENNLPASYHRVDGERSARLYMAKRRISVLALRVQLLKIAEPTTVSSEGLVQEPVQEAIDILRKDDLREPGNPALRWPLTILACAAGCDADLQFLIGKMKEFEVILDPSNASKLRCSYLYLEQWPTRSERMRLRTPLDILLEPLCPVNSVQQL